MRVLAATESGDPDRPNEDHIEIGADIAIVIDGATSRTETGCIHGVSWYAAQLGSAVQNRQYAEDSLTSTLARAIEDVADLHGNTCDLDHPGTPSAAITILRRADTSIQWLVIGDVTLTLETDSGLNVVTDDHAHIAAQEQAEADRYPIGDRRKSEAMLRMKKAELAQRNVPGGFWVATSDPAVVDHALTGELPTEELRRALLMSDGAARLADVFGLATHAELLELVAWQGPQEALRRVRETESKDPEGRQWPRNKRSDDATAVLCDFRRKESD
ncbi:protein phosphatase 2C domain-containing protein [Glycomyces xiaoerkulensis]|uniref:protein phosphatase 2C domain-containing protein n=1 Tax=Glycomyces xiaoerkulensis TaxID=2038139 RepID=UPI000C259CB7|nr:protein phosphatase 2C domain-containing protein [Glycomyces xiaoerkulensis]